MPEHRSRVRYRTKRQDENPQASSHPNPDDHYTCLNKDGPPQDFSQGLQSG
jgi:hypothetical protein